MKSSNVTRKRYVQVSGRLIGPELFSMSTGGDAETLCQHGRPIFFLRPFRILRSSGESIFVQYFLTFILLQWRSKAVQSGTSLCFSCFSLLFSGPLLRLRCSVCARNLPLPVARINLHRLSTCNRPHTVQGHRHLFHIFLRG